MSKGEKVSAEFKPVLDPNEAKKLLREGAKTFASATIWTKDQKHVIKSHLTVYSDVDKVIYAWIPKNFDLEKFVNDLIDLNTNDCFFSVSLAGANIFFKCVFKGYDSAGFQFYFPEQIYKVQRRKDLRYRIQDGRVLKVSFQDPLFPETRLTKKILDISAGGIAMLVTDLEEGLFHQGMILKNITIVINQREITVDGEVRHTNPLPVGSKDKGIKIGIMYKGLKQDDYQYITQFVFEETRKYLTRFI